MTLCFSLLEKQLPNGNYIKKNKLVQTVNVSMTLPSNMLQNNSLDGVTCL